MDSEVVRWPTYPFDTAAENLSRSCTVHSVPAQASNFMVLSSLDTPLLLPTVVPETTDIAILLCHYPDADAKKPPWSDIKIELLSVGILIETLKQSTSLEVVRLLDRVQRSSSSPKARKVDKQPLLEHFQRKGLAPVAFLCEAIWNLREWIRETTEDRTLDSVLRVLLPGVRRRVEIALVDAELSQAAANLPIGERLSAVSLLAAIERQCLPGGLRLRVPAGKPPSESQWASLTRMRALRIAMQLCQADGRTMFDSESESDLMTIEKLDKAVLRGLWHTIESFDPLDAVNEVDWVSKETIGAEVLGSDPSLLSTVVKPVRFPSQETLIAIAEKSKGIASFIRDTMQTTSGKRPFGANAMPSVVAELDSLTYLFYGRTSAEAIADLEQTTHLGWWISLAGWIVATPGNNDYPGLRENLAVNPLRFIHANYHGWRGPVGSHVDSLFWGMATLRVYFGQIVFSRESWIHAGPWLRQEIIDRAMGLACVRGAPLGPWFEGEMCREPLYLLKKPDAYCSPNELKLPPLVPDEIKRCGTFHAPKTDGIPAEWLDAMEHYSLKLSEAVNEQT